MSRMSELDSLKPWLSDSEWTKFFEPCYFSRTPLRFLLVRHGLGNTYVVQLGKVFLPALTESLSLANSLADFFDPVLFRSLYFTSCSLETSFCCVSFRWPASASSSASECSSKPCSRAAGPLVDLGCSRLLNERRSVVVSKGGECLLHSRDPPLKILFGRQLTILLGRPGDPAVCSG